MMLTLTSPVETWAHRLPAGAKMAALALWTVVLFQFASPLPLALTAAATAALPLSCGRTFALTFARMLRPLWPFVVVVALWHLWQHDLSTGAAILLRLITAVAAANFVTMTTKLTDMIRILTTLARPLGYIGLPPRVFALAVALVIRFLPVMLHRTEQIRESFRARSTRRPGWRILVPALLAALDDAESVAEALRARGGAG
jgi:biotin transport system permease protein